MRVDIKKISLMSAIIAVFLWFVITSICIVDLMDTQAVLIKCVRTLQDGMSDLYDYIYEPFPITQISLSDETKEIVDKLRMKHCEYGSFIYTDEDTLYYVPEDYKWTSIWFEEGVLYIRTQDGTWFIEMQRKEE